jgi:exodeoxyribonuclease X
MVWPARREMTRKTTVPKASLRSTTMPTTLPVALPKRNTLDMFIYLDTETTGSEIEDRLCQVAFKTSEGIIVDELFNPGMKISIESMSVHHITNEMVADKSPFKISPVYKKLQMMLSRDDTVMVAHNAKFDVAMLEREGLHTQKVICTYKLARYLDKEGIIPEYNLQYLRYYMKLNIEATPHTALGDVLVMENIFQKFYTKFSKLYPGLDPVSQMINISNSPVKIPFNSMSNTRM